MNDLEDVPSPASGIAFCFYCGTTTRKNYEGKWMCEEHYEDIVRSKYKIIHNQHIEKDVE